MDGWLFAGIWDKTTTTSDTQATICLAQTNTATSNGGATILVPGRACRWLGTYGRRRYPSSYCPPPPRPAVSVAVHTVCRAVALRCVALFNQKHASPRLGQMIPRVAGGRTDGIYHCFAAPIHTIAGRITGPNAIESIPPPSVTVRTYCQVLHTTERYVGTYEKPDDGSVAAAAARINTTTYDT